MPSLKELKTRIGSVKSTRKITSAMKMVAASKLRRNQEMAEAGRPYATCLGRMLASLVSTVGAGDDAPALLVGNGSDQNHLLLVLSSDRGLCGAFNGNIAKETRKRIRALQAEGKKVQLVCVGRKARDLLRRDFGSLIVQSYEDVGRKRLQFSDAVKIADDVMRRFAANECDVVTVIYNRFKSVLAQQVTAHQLIPAAFEANDNKSNGSELSFEFEPDPTSILAALLPKNLTVQVYSALVESAASEQGARMTAMDNATRNAGDMINRLTLNYNRSRQAAITKELIEIISGAEAI